MQSFTFIIVMVSAKIPMLKVFDEPGLLIYYNQTVDPEKVINMPSLKDLAFIVSEKRQRSARI